MAMHEHVSEEDRNRQILIEQFAYFADELQAQQVILDRIPEEILSTAPYPGGVSILDRYKALFDREIRQTRELSAILDLSTTDDVPESEAPDIESSIQALLSATVVCRKSLAERLRTASDPSWSSPVPTADTTASLSAWVYQAVLRDADDLREIGVQFSEMQLHFRKEN